MEPILDEIIYRCIYRIYKSTTICQSAYSAEMFKEKILKFHQIFFLCENYHIYSGVISNIFFNKHIKFTNIQQTIITNLKKTKIRKDIVKKCFYKIKRNLNYGK